MELMDLMRTNRTYRRFKQTAVSDEIIGEIMEAARNASSAANRQPLGYVVVKSPEKVAEVFALPSGQAIFHLSRDSQRQARSLCFSSVLSRIPISTRTVILTWDLPLPI